MQNQCNIQFLCVPVEVIWSGSLTEKLIFSLKERIRRLLPALFFEQKTKESKEYLCHNCDCLLGLFDLIHQIKWVLLMI